MKIIQKYSRDELLKHYTIDPKVSEEDKQNWVDTTIALINQVSTKIVLYVRHIEKLVKFKHIDLNDEHEDMFNVV